jgi:hypothetical protein
VLLDGFLKAGDRRWLAARAPNTATAKTTRTVAATTWAYTSLAVSGRPALGRDAAAATTNHDGAEETAAAPTLSGLPIPAAGALPAPNAWGETVPACSAGDLEWVTATATRSGYGLAQRWPAPATLSSALWRRAAAR